jgi:hypothetical protein
MDEPERLPSDWFEVHLRRQPVTGEACISYEYPHQPPRTLKLPPRMPEGCRGDPNDVPMGEFPMFTIHCIHNDGWGLPQPVVVRDPAGIDLVAASVTVDGEMALVSVRNERNQCSPPIQVPLVQGAPCGCPNMGAGHPCQTPPCWD